MSSLLQLLVLSLMFEDVLDVVLPTFVEFVTMELVELLTLDLEELTEVETPSALTPFTASTPPTSAGCVHALKARANTTLTHALIIFVAFPK